jgi:hypothetical protein
MMASKPRLQSASVLDRWIKPLRGKFISGDFQERCHSLAAFQATWLNGSA